MREPFLLLRACSCSVFSWLIAFVFPFLALSQGLFPKGVLSDLLASFLSLIPVAGLVVEDAVARCLEKTYIHIMQRYAKMRQMQKEQKSNDAGDRQF